MTQTIHTGHAIEVLRRLPAQSVHCCVTSPPYYGLRAYGTELQVWGGDPGCAHDGVSHRYHREGGGGTSSGEASSEAGEVNAERLKAARWKQDDTCRRCGAWRGEYGSEPTVGQYLADTVAIFREVWRVLRDDGTLWLNVGDSFNAYNYNRSGQRRLRGGEEAVPRHVGEARPGLTEPHLKPKDLMGIPWRVAFALQDDGWYLRRDVIWAKPSAMPESATDRPTTAHEYVFMLTKRQRYFYDHVAVREPAVRAGDIPGGGRCHVDLTSGGHNRDGMAANAARPVAENRNLRSVWTIATQPFAGAHFATFPPRLVVPMILAGTSEHGVCSKCGAPWRRVIDRDLQAAIDAVTAQKVPSGWDTEPGHHSHIHRQGRTPASHRGSRFDRGKTAARDGGDRTQTGARPAPATTLAWAPTCTCEDKTAVPATVLDPFVGAGTTLLVADRLGRHGIGIELNPESVEIARRRITNDAPMFAAVEVREDDLFSLSGVAVG